VKVCDLQPIQSHFKDFGQMFFTKHAEQLKRTALRRWSVIEKQLREVIDRLCLVACDEGLLSPAAAEYFSMSCMIVTILTLVELSYVNVMYKHSLWKSSLLCNSGIVDVKLFYIVNPHSLSFYCHILTTFQVSKITSCSDPL